MKPTARMVDKLCLLHFLVRVSRVRESCVKNYNNLWRIGKLIKTLGLYFASMTRLKKLLSQFPLDILDAYKFIFCALDSGQLMSALCGGNRLISIHVILQSNF